MTVSPPNVLQVGYLWLYFPRPFRHTVEHRFDFRLKWFPVSSNNAYHTGDCLPYKLKKNTEIGIDSTYSLIGAYL